MSIRARLTLWYVGLLAVALVLFDLAVYAVLSYRSYAEVDRAVQTTAEQIVLAIKAENDPVAVLISGRVRLPPVDVFSSTGTYWQVIRADGVIASRSDNLSEQSLPLDSNTLLQTSLGETVLATVQTENARLRMYSAPLIVVRNIIGTVQVGASLQGVDALLRRVAGLLAGGTLLAVLIAALVGYALARAALRPIDQVTQTALNITRAEDLGRRLDATPVHDEVGRLSATFNEMLGRLDELFRAQQHLVADVSHELRTPLTTIQGNLDLLRRGAIEDSDARREAIRAIEAEVNAMSRLVADLLLLAQADAGVKLEFNPVELDTLLLDVYRQALTLSNGVKVKLGNEDQALVMGDADRLRQLLLNLVDNALKYTPAGGEVSLSLHREPEWVRVSVADTGIGIPPEDTPHIFERFYRSDKARTRGRGGTGLGLAIAKWIAEAHDGRIAVESQVGAGSTFTVWLPVDAHP
jgi:signal transduction histidine kinase